MTWQAFQVPEIPPTIQEALDNASNIVDQVQSGLDVIKDVIQAARIFMIEDVNPALVAYQAMLNAARDTLKELSDASVYWLVVHPWVGQIGTPNEDNPWLLELNSREFLDALQESITDLGDENRPLGNGVMVVLAAGATTPSGFVAALQALGNLFDLYELRTLANRITALESIDFMPDTMGNSELPDWQNAGRLHTLVPPLGSVIRQLDSLLESMMIKNDLAMQALDQLIKFVDIKVRQIKEAQEALEKLQASLKQDFAGVHLLISDGSFNNAITSEGFPMNYRFCGGIALAGSTVDLQPLRTLLGQ